MINLKLKYWKKNQRKTDDNYNDVIIIFTTILKPRTTLSINGSVQRKLTMI